MSRSKTCRALTHSGDVRRAAGQNQYDFWTRFGVTQSGGSRYESGRAMPKSLQLLLVLIETGRITDQDLVDAGKVIAKPRK